MRFMFLKELLRLAIKNNVEKILPEPKFKPTTFRLARYLDSAVSLNTAEMTTF